jgi:hypothetical protein
MQRAGLAESSVAKVKIPISCYIGSTKSDFRNVA